MVAGLECFDPNLLPHLAVFALGVAMFTPLGESLALPALRRNWPSLETKLGRTFGGLLLICFINSLKGMSIIFFHTSLAGCLRTIELLFLITVFEPTLASASINLLNIFINPFKATSKTCSGLS